MLLEIIIVIVNRALKITGNLIRIFSYFFHAIFPKMRFTIPDYSPPILKSNVKTVIPKVLWQTNFTNRVSLPVYINYLFNRLMAPHYEYHHVSTEERLVYFEKYASPETIQAYKQLTDGASQADLWRVFVLNHSGGVYMDIDAHLVWPLSKLLNPDYKELILLNKEHYTNYFIASAKNNPILEKTIEIIVENIQQRKIDEGVYALTGPVTLNRAIGLTPVNHRFYRLTCIQGSFTNEHFQYIDKPRGKWIHANPADLLKK